MKKQRAVFLDRDGVINRIVYHRELGIIDTPFTVGQFRLLPGVAQAIRKINRLGLKAVVVSNQPGIAKRHFSHKTLVDMTKKMERAMKRGGAYLDAIYYCLHHPQAVNPAYKRRCPCRKPNPGLLKRGAEELKIDLKSSFLVGDGIPDIQAGRRAGCRTILIGNWKCDLCKLMEAKKLKPDYIASDILDAIRFIEKNLKIGS
jgi:D,D-heptose 1,7-bisphosphate phosphatase